MLNVNDDMDDLFKRAAENYPLKTDGADWEKVLGKMNASIPGAVDQPKERRRNYGFLWLLLLLIPLGWALMTLNISKGKKGTMLEATAYQPPANNSAIAGNTPTNTIPGKDATTNTNTGENVLLANADNQGSENKKLPAGDVPPVDQLNSTQLHLAGNLKRNSKAATKYVITTAQAGEDIAADNIAVVNNNKPVSVAPVDTKENDIAGQTVSNDKKTLPGLTVQKTISPAPTSQDGSKEKQPAVTQKDKQPTSNKKDSKVKISKDHFVYAGIIVGLDRSDVKSQEVRKAGTNIGVVAGYRINKRLSVESGLLSVKKYYYSDGKYFNTSKIYLPSYSKISKLDGNCQMLELPLSLKYHFQPSRRSGVYVMAGGSTYFMKKENYDYTIIANGTPYDHYSTYKKSSNYWLATVNLGAGYAHAVGKSAMIRIEPYFKIPLKGIGIGSLPINSTGVNISIVKKLF